MLSDCQVSKSLFPEGDCHVEEVGFPVGFRFRSRRGHRDSPRRLVRPGPDHVLLDHGRRDESGRRQRHVGPARPELVNDHHGRRQLPRGSAERGHRRLLRQQRPTSTITVNGNQNVGNITFDGSGYTLTGGTLTLGGGDITANQNARSTRSLPGRTAWQPPARAFSPSAATTSRAAA